LWKMQHWAFIISKFRGDPEKLLTFLESAASKYHKFIQTSQTKKKFVFLLTSVISQLYTII
jgi:hypothetical protein